VLDKEEFLSSISMAVRARGDEWTGVEFPKLGDRVGGADPEGGWKMEVKARGGVPAGVCWA